MLRRPRVPAKHAGQSGRALLRRRLGRLVTATVATVRQLETILEFDDFELVDQQSFVLLFDVAHGEFSGLIAAGLLDRTVATTVAAVGELKTIFELDDFELVDQQRFFLHFDFIGHGSFLC
jgi:hypothetical protein